MLSEQSCGGSRERKLLPAGRAPACCCSLFKPHLTSSANRTAFDWERQVAPIYGQRTGNMQFRIEFFMDGMPLNGGIFKPRATRCTSKSKKTKPAADVTDLET